MPTLTLFLMRKGLREDDVIKRLHDIKVKEGWLVAKKSKFFHSEVEVTYYFYEPIDDSLRKIFDDEEYIEIAHLLIDNGKYKVLRKIRCFINVNTGLVEVYRGPDLVTHNLKQLLEKLLNIQLKPVSLNSSQLVTLIQKYTIELRQAMFRNVDGFWYTILRGKSLETNPKFTEYLIKNHNSLRVISIRPKIRFLNGGKYTVTINGDRGTIKITKDGMFKWRPRFEIRQITFLIAMMLGLIWSCCMKAVLCGIM